MVHPALYFSVFVGAAIYPQYSLRLVPRIQSCSAAVSRPSTLRSHYRWRRFSPDQPKARERKRRTSFPRLLPVRLGHALWREPPLVMQRCGRTLLSKPPPKFIRLVSSAATPAVDSATPLPRPNALTLIHKTSALLPCILPPTPKHPVESLKLWTDLLDYSHNASVTHGGSVGSGNRKARIVGVSSPRSFSPPAPNFPLPAQCTEPTRTLARLIS